MLVWVRHPVVSSASICRNLWAGGAGAPVQRGGGRRRDASRLVRREYEPGSLRSREGGRLTCVPSAEYCPSLRDEGPAESRALVCPVRTAAYACAITRRGATRVTTANILPPPEQSTPHLCVVDRRVVERRVCTPPGVRPGKHTSDWEQDSEQRNHSDIGADYVHGCARSRLGGELRGRSAARSRFGLPLGWNGSPWLLQARGMSPRSPPRRR
jgi:hypothetical protein